jgi:hypothetical protein
LSILIGSLSSNSEATVTAQTGRLTPMMKVYDSLKLKRTKESFEELKKFGQKFVFEQKFARKTLFPL